MKKIFFLSCSVMLMAWATSCSTTTNDDIINEENGENWEHIQLPVTESSQQLGTYNALGYGYNVLGSYANENSVTSKIIDTDKFKSEQAQRLSEENILSQEYKEEYGENAAAFSKMLSAKVSATQQLRVFGQTIPYSTAILTNQKYDPSYIYGSYNLIIKQKRFRINADHELLSNYLTASFSKDVEEKNPEQIVKEYGTHIAVDIYIGSAFDQIFQAKTTNPNRESAARAGVKKAVNESNETDAIEASKNYAKKLFYKTRGGEKFVAMAGIYNLEKITPVLNYSNWQSTTPKENSVLVDFGDNGLIMIYDLVKNPVKKAELKTYVDQYLKNNQVTLE